MLTHNPISNGASLLDSDCLKLLAVEADMTKEALEKELAEAYAKLEKADKQVSNLLIERRDTNQVIEVLKAAGFLTDEKLCQAREIIMGLDS
jgi:hypothetical protein